MRIHSIECGTMCPASARLINGTGGWFAPARMVCHCWLIEAKSGLVLVDTGIGLEDLADVRGRLGRAFDAFARPKRDPRMTAARQIERLGFRREDVRHIVPTHLDPDHAGGLPDFPHADVHVFEPEHAAAMAPATRLERERYRRAHFAHGPRWTIHALNGGESGQSGGQNAGQNKWFGFDSVRAVGGTDDEVLLVPLIGHTRGHCGVAARDDDAPTRGGWRLHAGDAYFSGGSMKSAPSTPAGLRAFQRFAAVDHARMLENQRRLRELVAARSADVRVHSAHCPVELDAFATTPA